MRFSILTFAAVFGLLLARDAQAQYSPRTFAVGARFSGFAGSSERWAPALTLDGSWYIDHGFDVFLQVPLMIIQTSAGAETPSGAGQLFGTGGHLGIRYLFLQERVRPYAGVQLSALVLITKPELHYFFGPGAMAGVDFYLTDFLSLGVRGSYDLFVELNRPLRHGLGATVSLGTTF